MDEATEQDLIARFQAGDQGAYGGLFDAYHRDVVFLASRVLRDREAALDVTQEVFLRAFEGLRDWRGKARLSTWFYRTALHVCLERFRAEERHRCFLEQAPKGGTAPSPEDTAL
ncbi:MAG: hypothetical protein NTW87_35470, partial [Planctomycetota bacterium]|nr:hypothetical protein [Planctomycetota bacterium]